MLISNTGVPSSDGICMLRTSGVEFQLISIAPKFGLPGILKKQILPY